MTTALMAETSTIETTSEHMSPIEAETNHDSTTVPDPPQKRKYTRKPNGRPPGRSRRPPPPILDDEYHDRTDKEDNLITEEDQNEATEANAQAAIPTGEDAEHLALLKSDLFYWLDNLDDNTWQQLMVYVYRKEPIWLQDKAGGKPHYVAKLGTKFTIDDLKRMQGSGVYRIDVTIAVPTGGSRRMRTGEAHIMDPNYPPNLPVSDAWTSNPANSRWFWAIPLLERKEQEQGRTAPLPQARPNTQPAAAPNGTAPGEEDGGLLALARNAQRQLMELTDPRRQLDTMKELVTIMRPPTTGNGETSMLMSFMQEQMKDMRAELRAAREAATQAAQPKPDTKSQLLEFMELASLLGFKRAQREEPPDPWASFLEKVVDAAPGIAELIVNGRNANAQQHQPQARQLPPDPPEQDEQEEQTERNEQPDVTPQQQQIMQRLEPMIRSSVPEMIRTINAGAPDEFKRWVLDEHGRTNFNLLKDNVGAERLAELATSHAAIKHMIPGKEVVQPFFERVFA